MCCQLVFEVAFNSAKGGYVAIDDISFSPEFCHTDTGEKTLSGAQTQGKNRQMAQFELLYVTEFCKGQSPSQRELSGCSLCILQGA